MTHHSTFQKRERQVIQVADYGQVGVNLDYTPVNAVTGGQPIQIGTMLGVAPVPIPAGKLGAVSVQRVFALPKPTGANTNYALGSKVYWNGTLAVTGVTGIQAGYVAKQPATTDATVNVLLWPGS